MSGTPQESVREGSARPVSTLEERASIRRVDGTRPLHWLHRGWQDLEHGSIVSLAHGFVFALTGALLLALLWGNSRLALALAPALLLVAPLFAVNLYALSRRMEQGDATEATRLVPEWWPNRGAILRFALLLALALIVWVRISALLFGHVYGSESPNLPDFASSVLVSGKYPKLALAYLAAASMFGVLVFVISVVSLPMLVDRRIATARAIATSLKAVEANPGACLLWGVLCVLLTGLGLITGMIGLVLIYPWLAHSTWHAYRDMVE
jgi:uncharacterized membrane protein